MSKVGTDEWVAQHAERAEAPRSLFARVAPLVERVPFTLRIAVLVAIALAVPRIDSSDFVLQVGINALLLGLLALGLNVVVGYAGILDLGYVAFYGFGGYLYAILASPQLNHHVATVGAIVIATVATAVLGVLLGLPSRRLVGDYLAIVTLFFGQLFVQLTNNLDRLTLPWEDGPTNLTGGPNGITAIDPIRLPIWNRTLLTVADYYYLLVAVLAVVMLVLWRVNASRTGRAWRALREDPLAAGQMTIPVFRLRLLAFSIGAAVAGLSGAIFAAQQINVFPSNFSVVLIITVYAAVILGGSGSQLGVLLGAILIAVLPELLRDPTKARIIFYGVIVAALVGKLRPWTRIAAVVVGTALFGFVVRLVAEALTPRATSGNPEGSDAIGRAIGEWVLLPANGEDLGKYAFVALVLAVCGLSLLQGWTFAAALVPTLYLAVFVWENLLVSEPSITRQLLFGAILVVVMAVRPQGLLGTFRVEPV